MWRLLVILLLLPFAAFAQSPNDDEWRRLTALLDVVRQEQQSVYQQFQMSEALQRSEAMSGGTVPGIAVQDGRAPSYEDAARARQDRDTWLNYYVDEMRRLSARYRELGDQSTAIVEQMRALAQPGSKR